MIGSPSGFGLIRTENHPAFFKPDRKIDARGDVCYNISEGRGRGEKDEVGVLGVGVFAIPSRCHISFGVICDYSHCDGTVHGRRFDH